jgi:hypothetical protein
VRITGENEKVERKREPTEQYSYRRS